METLKLVYLGWFSEERDKYVYEDFYCASWDEVIGRVYLLKAHEAIEKKRPYADILIDFEHALLLLTKDGVHKEYCHRALADKAHVQCHLGQYEAGLATIDQVLAQAQPSDRKLMIDNRFAILVLTGAHEDALPLLQARLDQYPTESRLRFNLATCLLHLERYDEAAAAYQQAMTKDRYMDDDRGLKAARCRQQPAWANL